MLRPRAYGLCERGRASARDDRRARDLRHQPPPAARPHLHEPEHPRLSRLCRLLRHGRDDRAHRRIFQARGAGPRGAQAGALSPRPGGWRQVFARRAAQTANGETADLHAEGRQADEPGLREPPGPVRPADHGGRHRAAIPHSKAPPGRDCLALGLEAARRVRRRHLQIHGGAAAPLAPAADLHCQDRAGDENNQDISSLVGKVDIRKLEVFSQGSADAYAVSGGLNRTTQGLLEFVEMFKAPIKTLHPLLTATQEGNYIGSENIGAIPYQGIIMAHSNEAEWQGFKKNRTNEAFIDRICVIKVPYCLRAAEEQKIYEKLLSSSELAEAPCAPSTLEMLARFCVLSRVKPHENSNLYSKMRTYDGESLKDSDPRAKTAQECRDAAGVDEGMEGLSTH